jgi:hypothetical protein
MNSPQEMLMDESEDMKFYNLHEIDRNLNYTSKS